jgi:hypothetical protein
VGWTVEKFVEVEKENPKVKASSKGRSTPTEASQSKAKMPAAKKKSALKKTSKATKKIQSPKRKRGK